MENGSNKSTYMHAIAVQEKTLNEDNLKEELQENQILCKDEVLAQIMLESGNLGSDLLKKTNNMLGMRFPFSRNSTAIGLYLPGKDTILYGKKDDLKKYKSANQYAVYKNWQDAIKDYKCWQTANFNLSDKYLHFLSNIYAKDTAYIFKIKQITMSRNNKLQ